MKQTLPRQNLAVGAVILGLSAIVGSLLVPTEQDGPAQIAALIESSTQDSDEQSVPTEAKNTPINTEATLTKKRALRKNRSAADDQRYISLKDQTTEADQMPKGKLSTRVRSGELGRGQTVAKALMNLGQPLDTANQIVKALKGIYDFRLARPGARFEIRLDEAGRMERFQFEHSQLEVYVVEREKNGQLTGRQALVPVTTKTSQLGARVTSSIYMAVRDIGESPALAGKLAGVFAWDLDFHRDTRPGDRFKLVVEKFFKEQDFVRYGRVLAAEYAGAKGTFRVYWFQPKGKSDGRYFMEDGQSAEKVFLATPLKFARISSRFNKKRKHPILGYTKAHLGVDYAAPRGTPVWSIAAGKVTFAGWKGANGRLVRIDHGNGLVSGYAHLHKIRKGIRRGTKVRQKQVIGYVGSTGRSTGPHLHFAMRHKGRFVNPQTLKVNRLSAIPRQDRARFKSTVKSFNAILESIKLNGSGEAR